MTRLVITDNRCKRERLPLSAAEKNRKEPTMAERRDYMVRPPHRVFESIDMRGGNTTECWPWLGYMDPITHACVFHWRGRRYRAQRIVYALRNGVPFSRVPKLASTCSNYRCCNPNHLLDRYSLATKLAAATRPVHRPSPVYVNTDERVVAYQVL